MFRGTFSLKAFSRRFIVILVTLVSILIFSAYSQESTESEFLQIKYLHVPTPLLAGDSALLSCHYELHANETLYAVKWYKDMGEFFRYVPGSEPKFKTLAQPGIDVDVSRSTTREVFLRNLGLDSLGNYTCQVSTDRPFFRCVQTTRYMEVVVPPSDGPILVMDGDKSDFELGDNVSIECASGRGKPAPALTWYINDSPAESLLEERKVVVHSDSLESSSLMLKFDLRPEIFKEGKVVLKCVASLHQLASEATKEIVAGRRGGQSHCFASVVLLTLATIFNMLIPQVFSV